MGNDDGFGISGILFFIAFFAILGFIVATCIYSAYLMVFHPERYREWSLNHSRWGGMGGNHIHHHHHAPSGGMTAAGGFSGGGGMGAAGGV